MPDSPSPASPYEVLGVPTGASMEDLRRAYRRRLRETHPDTGGEAVEFHAVQVAWRLIGTPDDRASFDASFTRTSTTAPSASTPPASWADFAAAPDDFSRRQPEPAPTARSYGHPGGWNRQEYFELMREWVGRGSQLQHPYDAGLVRSAPREIRHLLADAIAEEDTARTLSQLDIAYTVWHDVHTDLPGPGPDQKLDHIVLGPTGLFAFLSEDWGGALQIRKGEIVSDMLSLGERPMNSLGKRVRSLARSARVKFSALGVIVPDGSTADSLAAVGREKGIPTVIIQKSRLAEFVEMGMAGETRLSADDLFAARDRLQQVIRFI